MPGASRSGAARTVPTPPILANCACLPGACDTLGPRVEGTTKRGHRYESASCRKCGVATIEQAPWGIGHSPRCASHMRISEADTDHACNCKAETSR